GAGDVTLAATGDYEVRTDAEGGAEGGTAVSPVVAISVAGNRTEATIGTGGTLTAAGTVSATATHDAETVSVAKGDATGMSAAVGISFALTLAEDEVTATLHRGVTADGGVALTAQGRAVTRSEAEASAAGAE